MKEIINPKEVIEKRIAELPNGYISKKRIGLQHTADIFIQLCDRDRPQRHICFPPSSATPTALSEESSLLPKAMFSFPVRRFIRYWRIY